MSAKEQEGKDNATGKLTNDLIFGTLNGLFSFLTGNVMAIVAFFIVAKRLYRSDADDVLVITARTRPEGDEFGKLCSILAATEDRDDEEEAKPQPAVVQRPVAVVTKVSPS